MVFIGVDLDQIYTRLTIGVEMALVKGADRHHMAETISPEGQNGFRWGCNGLYWGRFRPDWQNGATKGQISFRG